MRRWWIGGLVFAAMGCGNEAREGVNPGECSDGADNDADGYYDCNDIDCAFAPDCEDDDTDPGKNVSDTDSTKKPTDTDEEEEDKPVQLDGVAAHLRSMALTYRVQFDFDVNTEVICRGFFGIPANESCDCEATYRGEGRLIESELERNTYEGSFELVSTTCVQAPPNAGGGFANMTLNDAAIFRPSPPDGFHTFRFDRDVSKVHEWVSHQFAQNHTTTQNPFGNAQFWMKLTVQARNGLDPETLLLDYAEQELTHIEFLVLTARHRLIVQFSEDATPPDYPAIPE